MNCLELPCPCEVEEYCPTEPEKVAYHTEIIVANKLKIPDAKPPKEKIIKSTRKICITKVKPIAVKLSNGCFVGCKVLVTGIIKIGIEYSANLPEQSVHFVHYDIPFKSLIMGGDCHKPIPLQDCDLKKFKLHVCVEDFQIHQLDERTLKEVIVLLLWLERINPHNCNDENDGEDCRYLPQCEEQEDEEQDEERSNKHHPHEPPGVTKEIAIDTSLVIPPQKPPAECILDSGVVLQITKAKIINTPLISCHDHLPIKKVVILGEAEITIKYAADVPDQQVHAAHFIVPFETLIEWPGGPPENSPISLKAKVEHFQVHLLDNRQIFKVLIIGLHVSSQLNQ